MQTRHLIATAVERDAVLGGIHLVLVRQALEVSAIGRCSAGAGLLRQQVAVGWHLVQRAGVGDAAVSVGWHLVVVHDGGAVGVAALDGLRRELPSVLGRVGHAISAERGTGGGFPGG